MKIFEIGLQARHFYTTSNSFIKILKLNKIINKN